MDYKKYIVDRLRLDGVESDDLLSLLVTPPDMEMGNFSLPCFKLAKIMRKPPIVIADELARTYVTDDVVRRVVSLNGYLNFYIDEATLVKTALSEILSAGDDAPFGSSKVGDGKTVCIDYSSINIAKPFHIGHLSTTVIGAALYRTYKFAGYNVVGINHLGDYGTQFGKLIVAFKKWGDREKVEKNTINEMLALYVRFHEEAEKDDSLNDEARRWFKLIEEKNEEALGLFNWFKELTLREVAKVYDLLGVHFDSYAGESFYSDKMQPVTDALEAKGLLKESDGAQIVDLEKYNMPPCLIKKADGASLYATRDIAAALYRYDTYRFEKCLYVVAYQQNLHFKQFFKVIELLGWEFADKLEHVAFGMVSLEDGGSMSTRHGRVVFLEDVLKRSIEKAGDIIREKNPDVDGIDTISRQVGVGAVIFSTLYNSRIKDIVFSYDRILNFDGETGPYVQYTATRAGSVLKKAVCNLSDATYEGISAEELKLVTALCDFPETVLETITKNEPCCISRYLMDVAQKFNKFYFDCRILNADSAGIVCRRVAITKATYGVISKGLALLGIETPEKM